MINTAPPPLAAPNVRNLKKVSIVPIELSAIPVIKAEFVLPRAKFELLKGYL